MPSPPGCDLKQSTETLEMIMSLSPAKFFLGHYGICNTPNEIMKRALAAIQLRSDIGLKAIEQGKQDELTERIILSIAPDIDKLRLRGEILYQYLVEELIPVWAKGFMVYYETL